jgi:hypothetical protein
MEQLPEKCVESSTAAPPAMHALRTYRRKTAHKNSVVRKKLCCLFIGHDFYSNWKITLVSYSLYSKNSLPSVIGAVYT